jgi:hypothetical protein
MASRPPHPHSPSPTPPATVQVWVGARRHNPWLWWLTLLLLLAGLGGGLLLLTVSFRWGLQLILDPETAPPFPIRLGGWGEVAVHSETMTLGDLETKLAATQQTLGEPVELKLSPDGKDTTVWIVPGLDSTSGAIASLYALHPQQSDRPPDGHPSNHYPQSDADQGQFILLTSVTVPPFAPAQILSPLRGRDPEPPAVTGVFLPTELTSLPRPEHLGLEDHRDRHWLTLEGRSQYQGTTLRYGQMVVFDPQAQTLGLLELWSSPTNRLPYWVDLAGTPGLLVDETIGLDPSLRGWQLVAGRLEPISWFRIPLDAGPQGRAYHQVLRLARSGLWNLAADQLAALKSTLADQWNQTAEAQLQLISRHATLTRQQAEQDWASPTQHILALLVDGRWEAALANLEANTSLLPALVRRFESDNGRFWNRVSGAATLTDVEPALYVWGALALTAQQNRGAAQDWLDRQTVPGGQQQRWATLLQTLETPTPILAATAQAPAETALAKEVGTAPEAALRGVTGVMGVARPLESVVADRWYLPPGSTLEGNLGTWYAIELQGLRQYRWQSAPLLQAKTTDLAGVWTALMDGGAPPLQLLHWASTTEGRGGNLSVRGVQVTDGTITLLATGASPWGQTPLPPLVFSQGSLGWLDGHQRQSVEVDAVRQGVEGAIAPSSGPISASVVERWVATNAVQSHRMDITGDGRLEQVLTLQSSALDQLQGLGISVNRAAHKTLILDADQGLLYSNLFSPHTVVALTTPGAGQPLGLLVYHSGRYQALSWSAVAQRFE